MNTPAVDQTISCTSPAEAWAEFNRTEVFERPELRTHVAPFPPRDLMQNVSGLTSERDFASHGADFWIALSQASAKPLSSYASVLDLGCGCGRLARMFRGHPGEIHGCDIDARHVAWIRQSLDYMQVELTKPDAPLPYGDGRFELIISISVFTHLNEASQDVLLAELARVASRRGTLLLTIHGERALERAQRERAIFEMISVDPRAFERAAEQFERGRHAFILQNGHLTNADFDYGITFIPKAYVLEHWSRWFTLKRHVSGALHDFQDVLVLEPR